MSSTVWRICLSRSTGALEGSNFLTELTRNTNNAPHEIKHLTNDVSNVVRVLSWLDASLNRNRTQKAMRFDQEISRVVYNLQGPSKDRFSMSDGLAVKLGRHLKPV